jgi:hypothetical protein
MQIISVLFLCPFLLILRRLRRSRRRRLRLLPASFASRVCFAGLTQSATWRSVAPSSTATYGAQRTSKKYGTLKNRIRTDASGCKTVDKVVHGVRIYQRLGKVSQAEAEQFLADHAAAVKAARVRDHILTYRSEPVAKMNNTAWQRARREASQAYMEDLGRTCPEGFSSVMEKSRRPI